MKTIISVILPVILPVLFFAALIDVDVTSAQATRSKLWGEAGIGTGGIFFNCSACESPIRSFGEVVYVRGGVQLSDRVLLGIESHSLLSKTFQPTGGNDVSDMKVTSISPIVIWFPWRYGMFIKGGFGVSTGEIKSAETEHSPQIIATGSGSGMTFGAGIDVPIQRWIALTVSANVHFGAIGDVTVEDILVDDLISTSYDFNFGITLR